MRPVQNIGLHCDICRDKLLSGVKYSWLVKPNYQTNKPSANHAHTHTRTHWAVLNNRAHKWHSTVFKTGTTECLALYVCVCVEMFAGLVSLVCEKNQHTKCVTADVQMDSTGLHVLMISLGKRNLFKLKLTAFTSTFCSAFVDEI